MGSEQLPNGDAVVVPALDAASSVACLRSLGKRGVRTIAVSEAETPPGFSSKYCDEVVSVPDPTVDLSAYENSLLSLAERSDVRSIVPVREADVYVLARNKSTFERHVSAPWPSLETLSGAQDRVRLFDAAAAAGVSTPETTTLDEWDDWERDAIVKPRYTIHAAEYVDHVAESHTHQNSTEYLPSDERPDRSTLVEEMGHVPLVQEFVGDSDEYGFFALYDRGDPVATFQHRQRRGYKYCGGPSAYRESVDIPELESAGRRLLDRLDWHGLAMVEFLRDPETDEFVLMEVNPRFWTSLPFTIQAGVDFPHLYWSQATGRSFEPPEYDVGVAGHLLRGELCYLHSLFFDDYPLVDRPSIPESVASVVASLVRHPRFDYLDGDDPRPFVRDLLNVVGDLGGRGTSGERDPTETVRPRETVAMADGSGVPDGWTVDDSEPAERSGDERRDPAEESERRKVK